MKLIKRIAHPTDFSSGSMKALAWAVALAKQNQAELLLIHVLPLPTPIFERESMFRPEAEASMSALIDNVQSEGVKARRLLLKGTASIHGQVLRSARVTQADLIVVSRRRRALPWLFMGNLTKNLVAKSRCPVLVVPNR